MPQRTRPRTVLALLLAAAFAFPATGCQSVAGSQASRQARTATAMPTPTTTATGAVRQVCARSTRTSCYTFDQLRQAYGVKELNDKGLDGSGRTVAALDVVGSPHLGADLKHFSEAMKLPAPRLTVRRQSPGKGKKAAAFDWKNPNMVAMAREATMDVQALHAMAPKAELLFYQVDLERRDAERGITARAMDLLAQGIRTVVEEHEVDVLSLSFVFPEQGDSGQSAHVARVYREMRPVLEEAAAHGVTVVAASGDLGAAPDAADARREDRTPRRTVSWPASDPGVTAVGGTRLTLDTDGNRRSPDTVWHDRGGASGGGTSVLAARPGYQDGVKDVTGRGRGVPDVSLTASATGSTMIWFTQDTTSGWALMLGTSLAAPLFGGLVALGAQQAGKGLGAVNKTLYASYDKDRPADRSGVVDIVNGVNGDHGYRATPGYDLASGLGTVDAPHLIPVLAHPTPSGE